MFRTYGTSGVRLFFLPIFCPYGTKGLTTKSCKDASSVKSYISYIPHRAVGTKYLKNLLWVLRGYKFVKLDLALKAGTETRRHGATL